MLFTSAVAVHLLMCDGAHAAPQRDQPVSVRPAVQFGGVSLLGVLHARAKNLHQRWGVQAGNSVREGGQVAQGGRAALVEHLEGVVERGENVEAKEHDEAKNNECVSYFDQITTIGYLRKQQISKIAYSV